MPSDTFDRSRLSVREGAILEAAIEGMTDIQIAQRLDISQSTVNSYWVRIRGKLGQLSRTELVALALKQEAQGNMNRAAAQIAALQAEASAHARVSPDFANSEVYRAALDAMPEPMLVSCERAVVRYANTRLEALFGYDVGELVNQPVAVLLPPSEREEETARIVAFMKDPHPLRIGIDRVLYGQRRNGERFRILLLLDARPTSIGNICACVIRDFATEIGTRRDHAAGWS